MAVENITFGTRFSTRHRLNLVGAEVNGVLDAIAAMQATIDAMQDEIDALTTRVTTLEGEVDTLQLQVGSLQVQVSTNSSDIAGAVGDINDLDARVAVLEGA